MTDRHRPGYWADYHRDHPSDRHAPSYKRKPRTKRVNTSSKTPVYLLPFAGVDGEGAGVDELGRQQYRLLRAGKMELYNEGAPLTTHDCLNMLSALDPGLCYVSFYFDYDVTMILRDLNKERRERLLYGPKPALGTETGAGAFQTIQSHLSHSQRLILASAGEKRDAAEEVMRDLVEEWRLRVGSNNRGIDWHEFKISYLPHRAFTVQKRGGPRILISDVSGFFQCSFVKAITQWEVGNEQRRAIVAENKERRASFTEIDDGERAYNRLECNLLAELMEKFRSACQDAGYVPRRWQGAGTLASQMLVQHEFPKRRDSRVQATVERMANAAYYGGRFEVTNVGRVAQPIWEYDINSAYPAAMLGLPCKTSSHFEWKCYPRGSQISCDGLFLIDISFDHPEKPAVCNLPVRQKTGTICWPRRGRGVYWSTEIRAALAAGTIITKIHGRVWRFVQHCDCSPLAWVRDLYAERKRIGKATKGYALKLGMNSLYGKFAQAIGSAPYGHRDLAGLITADCRARLIRSYIGMQEYIVMLATDGIYSTAPLPVAEGSELGQWESKRHLNGMFIVQPGLYWFLGEETAPKTRGIPQSRVLAHKREFEDVWAGWAINCHHSGLFAKPPSVEIPLTNFIGLRLAQARGKPDLAGKWAPQSKTISFAWGTKRAFDITQPLDEAPNFQSIPYKASLSFELMIAKWDLEAMPDYEELNPE